MSKLTIQIDDKNMHESLQESLNYVIKQELGGCKVRDIIREQLSGAISDRVVEALSANIKNLDVSALSNSINETIVNSFIKGARLLIIEALARSVVNLRSNGYMSQDETNKEIEKVRLEIAGVSEEPIQSDLDIS